MHLMTKRHSATLGILTLAFAGAWMTGACGSNDAGPVNACDTPSNTPSDTPTATPTNCSTQMVEPCMRYRIPLVGNPSFDVALRNKYIAAFGSACYMSFVNTFDCFYEKWEDACADAVKIGEVAGIVPYDKGYKCQPDGVGNYTLQVGPDVANQIQINYQAAPRQTPFVEINGVPTEVNGPYRNLTEPNTLGPGQTFECATVGTDANGDALTQRKWILQVNRNAHGGKIHSDLAGFTWPCKNEKCEPVTCTEPLVLPDSEDSAATYPNVHHVVPRQDKRSCPWGTNSHKNAAVISAKLNKFLTNNDPPAAEVQQLNTANAYTP